jgi:hypothetical protein
MCRRVAFKGIHERAIILTFFFNNAPCRKIQRWCSSQCTYKTYIHIFICILKQKSIYNLLFYPTWVEKKMRGWVKWNKCYSSEYYYT